MNTYISDNNIIMENKQILNKITDKYLFHFSKENIKNLALIDIKDSKSIVYRSIFQIGKSI